LQNRVGELYSLVRFLGGDPFSYYFCKRCDCKSLHWKFSDKRTCDGTCQPELRNNSLTIARQTVGTAQCNVVFYCLFVDALLIIGLLADTCFWNNEILTPIQKNAMTGPGKIAFKKLRILLDRMMLRRTKVWPA
jgi:DNA repair protein RAD16